MSAALGESIMRWSGTMAVLLVACAPEAGEDLRLDVEATAASGCDDDAAEERAREALEDAREDAEDAAATRATSPACGDVLTRSTKLRADVGPCQGDGLVIGADDITLDCDGHRMTGTETFVGVILDGRASVTVKDCRIEGFGYAIRLEDTIGNRIVYNHLGRVRVDGGVGDRIAHNRFDGEALDVGPSDVVAVVDNEVRGGSLAFLIGGHNFGLRARDNVIEGSVEVIGDARGLRLYDNRVEDGHVLVEEAEGNRFEDNTLRGAYEGFSVLDSSRNLFRGNDVRETTEAERGGFVLWGSQGARRNVLRDNRSDDNAGAGFLLLDNADINVLDDNDACGNGVADLLEIGTVDTFLFDNDFCVVIGP